MILNTILQLYCTVLTGVAEWKQEYFNVKRARKTIVCFLNDCPTYLHEDFNIVL